MSASARKSWHEHRLIGFDVETTSRDPTDARIVTYALVYEDPGGRERVEHRVVDPGVDIPEETVAVHGVTTERARDEGCDPAEALDVILDAFDFTGTPGERRPLVAFNAAYDLTVVWHELYRHGLQRYAPVMTKLAVIDPLVIDRQVWRYRKGKRRLGDCCDVYGVTLDDWHDAAADAIAAVRLARALAARYPTELDLTCDELHGRQVTWAAMQAASLQDWFRRQGKDEVVDGRWPLRPDRTAARLS